MIIKQSRFRIKDARWTTKDKLDQYRGVLKLYGKKIFCDIHLFFISLIIK